MKTEDALQRQYHCALLWWFLLMGRGTSTSVTKELRNCVYHLEVTCQALYGWKEQSQPNDLSSMHQTEHLHAMAIEE
jgi:hypothetical protein